MSNCLVLQGKNFIAIGADTASSILIDGKYRRIGTDAKKLYRFGNEIMFCSGRMALVELVTSNIVMKDNKIVLNSLTDFIKSLSIQKADTYDLEVLICGVENNKSYMHQISQYNDFEVKTVTNDTSGCAVYSTGFNAKTMLDTTKKNYGLCKNISDLFIKSFTDISSDEVGGYINMYLVQENQITKCVDSQKVDDVESISVSNDNIHFVIADCLIGDMIIGETLLVANSTGTFIVDKDGIIVKRMKLDMSNADGSRRIVIDPELDSILSVYTNSKQVFYVDTNGNMCMLGNLYINNNGVYLKADMTAENIIEVGYGEISGTGNEGESEVVTPSTEVVTEWRRSTDALNLTNYAWNNWGHTYSDVQYFYAKNICNQQVLEKDGEVYILFSSTIKRFKGTTWETMYDFSNDLFSFNGVNYTYTNHFIKTNKNDDYIYIITSWDRSAPGLLISKYNLSTNSFIIMNSLNVNSYTYENYYTSAFLDSNNILYISSTHITSNTSAADSAIIKHGYYQLDSFETDEEYLVNSINKTVWGNGKYHILDYFIYNGSAYAFMFDVNTYLLSIYKVNDMMSQNFLHISDLCELNDSVNDGVRRFCHAVCNNQLYVFTYLSSRGNCKFYVYNFSDGTIEIHTGNNNPYIDTYRFSGKYKNGTIAFSYDGEVHLYNAGLKASGYANYYPAYYWYNYENNSPTYLFTINHYIYNPKYKISISPNFSELDTGKSFLNSVQANFITIGDKIYCTNAPYLFRGTDYGNTTGTSTSKIMCLDTSVPNSEWKDVFSLTNANNYIVNLVNSNAEDKIYFNYRSKSNGNICLGYYDLVNQVAKYCNGTGFVENISSGVSLGGWASFAYIDDTTKVRYRLTSTLDKIELLQSNARTTVTTLSNAVTSNIICENNTFYYVAAVNAEKYSLYSCSFDGNVSKLSDIFSGYSADYGFSIFLYNNRVHIYHSEYGKLSSTRYIYNLTTNELISCDDVFQDLGLYTIEHDTSGNFSCCFLPAIPTSTGVHFFVGYPIFRDNELQMNGGYKHYLYVEQTPNDDDDSGDSSIPDVINPDENGKIFYITNTGSGHFYGNVYANDGIFKGTVYANDGVFKGTVYAEDGVFKGDIYARSLILGNDVTIDTQNISGIDDYLNEHITDYVGDSNIITSEDFSYIVSEPDENGVTKVTTVFDGVESTTYTSADGNYILTNVGLGNESDTYCKISADGLLEAKNAVITGQANIGKGYIGGWCINNDSISSVENALTTTGSMTLSSDGEIEAYGEDTYVSLKNGELTFYDTETETEVYVPEGSSEPVEITKHVIVEDGRSLNLSSSGIRIECNEVSPAIKVVNTYDGGMSSFDSAAVSIKSEASGYASRPFEALMKVEGTMSETETNVDQTTRFVMFGEESSGRATFRSDTQVVKNVDGSLPILEIVGNEPTTESSAPVVPSTIGTPMFRWYQGWFMELYSTNGLNTSSDKKIKNHIDYLSPDESLEFCNKLQPVEYTLKNNANGRVHRGFYAQDVKQVADDMELGNLSLYSATWNKDEQECYYSEDAPDEELQWTLKYEEFIAPLVGAVQALTKRVEDLEADNEKLRTRIEKLEGASE